MAKKSTTSGVLFSKLGASLQQSYEAHKADETDYGSGGELPAGIELGVAKLTDCKFDTYKTGKLQGKFYFYAAGIVVEPKTHTLEGGRVVRVEGLRTSIMEPLCDTPDSAGKKKTFDDHFASILNEIRKLGVDTAQVPPDQLEAVVNSLADGDIHFGFRTWSGKPTAEYPEPRVTHTWTGACEYEETTTDDVVEEEAPVLEEVPVAPAPVVATKKTAKKPAPPPAPEPVPDSGTIGEDEELESIIEAAIAGDEGAQLKLAEIGETAGVPNDAIVNAPDWETVGQLVRDASGDSDVGEDDGDVDTVALGAAADAGDTEAEALLTAIAVEAGLDPNDGEAYPDWKALGVALAGEGGEEEYTPTVGSVCKYTPVGKTKAVDCEITYIDAAKRTVNLKNLADNKPFKGVSWDKLKG